MWYAILMDEGLVHEAKTYREIKRKVSHSKVKRMSAGFYEMYDPLDSIGFESTYYVFNGKELVNKHGFDWVFNSDE